MMPRPYHPALEAVREAVEGIDVASVGEAIEVLQARDLWPADDDRRGFWRADERLAAPVDVFDVVSIAAIGADAMQRAEGYARALTCVALDMVDPLRMFRRSEDVTWRPMDPVFMFNGATMVSTIMARWLKRDQLAALGAEFAVGELAAMGLRVSWPFGESRGAALMVAGVPDRRASRLSGSWLGSHVGTMPSNEAIAWKHYREGYTPEARVSP